MVNRQLLIILFGFFVLISVDFTSGTNKLQIPIGVLIQDENSEDDIIFRTAVDRINANERAFEIVPIVKYVMDYDSYKTQKLVCQLASIGVAAIFGPKSTQSSGIVESICSKIEIPHIISHWKPEPFYINTQERSNSMTLNLYPESNLLAKALADLIIDYGWRKFTVIYETDEGLMRIKDVLEIVQPKGVTMSIRQLSANNHDYRPMFKDIQKTGEGHIILDCEPTKIVDILLQAGEVKMMGEYTSYVITSLNVHTVNFDELKLTRANITTLRLFDPENGELKLLIGDVVEHGQKQIDELYSLTTQQLKTESVLLYDSVKLFANSIKEWLQNSEDDDGVELTFSPIKCKRPSKWEFGSKIIESIKARNVGIEKNPFVGVTNEILFDEFGYRTHFQLDVVEFSKDGFKKIAHWQPDEGVVYTRSAGEVDSLRIESLQNKTVVVVSRLGPPFLLLRVAEEGEVLEGNARFEGYSIDLIDGISKILKFNYRFELVPDNKYGSFNKDTKQWDGLVKHLLDRKADLAICDLTITYERRTAVDFTMPFMTLGISILFAKPVKEPPNLFSFLSPLSLDVWIYMATAYLGVSILLFVLARMAPDEWQKAHACDKDSEEVENIWNLVNSTWLTMGSIMGQGCDILPRAISTRLVVGMWWFFALIMLSSYTANLAAFLTMERMDVTIENADDLAKQSKIKYGAVDGGSTLSFFKGSNFSTFQRMWSNMESTRPSVFTKSNQEGVERVSKGKRLYAFLMESSSLEYIIERNCDLTQIGGMLDNKGYGIAMPVNSPYRTAISGAVLKMQEGGQLLALKTKWWKEMHGGGSCQEETSSASDSAAELGIGNVGGVFVVLVFGCLIGLLIGIIEFLWNIKKVAVEDHLTPMEAFKAELKFAAKIWITTKPVHQIISSSSSEQSIKSKSRGRSETKSFQIKR